MRYLVRNDRGEEFGPFSSGDLRALVKQNRLGDGDFVRREIGSTWHPFATIPGLGCESPPPRRTPARDSSKLLAATVQGWDAEKLADVEVDEPPSGLLAEMPGRGLASDSTEDDPTTSIERRPERPVRPERPSHDTPTLEELAARLTPSTETFDGPPIDTTIDRSEFDLPNDDQEEPGPMTRPAETGVLLRESLRDALRRSLLAAILGRRATLNLGPRRIEMMVPGVFRVEMHACWFDAVAVAEIRQRRLVVRTLLGLAMILGAIGAIATGIFGSTIAVGSPAFLVGASAASVLLIVGFTLLWLSSARTLEIHAGSRSLRFPCREIEPSILDWIDERRRTERGMLENRIQSSNSSEETSSTRS